MGDWKQWRVLFQSVHGTYLKIDMLSGSSLHSPTYLGCYSSDKTGHTISNEAGQNSSEPRLLRKSNRCKFAPDEPNDAGYH